MRMFDYSGSLGSLVLAVAVSAVLANASSAIADGGCTKDTDCKGDRICEKGVCIDPQRRVAGSTDTHATEPPPLDGSIIVEIGLVRVAATRPNGKAWDTVTAAKQYSVCDIVEAAPQLGPALATVCKMATDEGPTRKTHDESAPDIFVRIQTGERGTAGYRTYTAKNLYSHDFHARFVIPLAAIPGSGLQVEVVDDDGEGSNENEEVIGSIQIDRAKLEALLRKQAEFVWPQQSDGSIEKIVVNVGRDVPTDNTRKGALLAQRGAGEVPGLLIDAGQVVEICAAGRYQVKGGEWIDPRGSRGNPDFAWPNEPFRSAPYGAAIALIGEARLVTPAIVSPCARVVARSSGRLAVGINDRDPKDDDGKVYFAIRVADPTVDEWRSHVAARKARADMPAPAVPDNSNAAKASDRWLEQAETLVRSLADKRVAEAIIKATHPSGSNAKIDGLNATRQGDEIIVDLSVSWSGLVLDQHTTIRWQFDRDKYISVAVLSDTALMNANMQELDKLFRAVYRLLRDKLNK